MTIRSDVPIQRYLEAIEWKCRIFRKDANNEHADEFDPIQPWSEPVAFTGNVDTDILIVGRDLGLDEVKNKECFFGKSGQLLRTVMDDLGHKLSSYFIINTVPYKPVGNKAFSKEVRAIFKPAVYYFVKLIEPKYVITCGKESLETFWPHEIGSILKFIRETQGGFNMVLSSDEPYKRFLVIPVPHPSYLLRRGGIKSQECKELFIEQIKRGLSYTV